MAARSEYALKCRARMPHLSVSTECLSQDNVLWCVAADRRAFACECAYVLVYRWARLLEVDASDDMVMSLSTTSPCSRSSTERDDLESLCAGADKCRATTSRLQDETTLSRHIDATQTARPEEPAERFMGICLRDFLESLSRWGVVCPPSHRATATHCNPERMVEQTAPLMAATLATLGQPCDYVYCNIRQSTE